MKRILTLDRPLGPKPRRHRRIGSIFAAAMVVATTTLAGADPGDWRHEWPRTDFSRSAIDWSDIVSGGPPKDGIPAIDDPKFVDAAEARGLSPVEPVISVEIAGDARAYPLRILIWHEIVNDTVGGRPVAVTWCPLCNSSVVFDRRVDSRTLSFGTTGKLRNSDLIMYDRETESWWQQFVGEAIVGELLGTVLKIVPARVESVERFRERFPHGRILVPPRGSLRPYGRNPYAGYDSSASPFLYRGEYKGELPPLARVVSVEEKAWSLDLLKRKRRIVDGEIVLTWTPGQASALDAATIDAGQDIGNVVVQRRTAGGFVDVPYDVSFAFAFLAFFPDASIRTD